MFGYLLTWIMYRKCGDLKAFPWNLVNLEHCFHEISFLWFLITFFRLKSGKKTAKFLPQTSSAPLLQDSNCSKVFRDTKDQSNGLLELSNKLQQLHIPWCILPVIFTYWRICRMCKRFESKPTPAKLLSASATQKIINNNKLIFRIWISRILKLSPKVHETGVQLP